MGNLIKNKIRINSKLSALIIISSLLLISCGQPEIPKNTGRLDDSDGITNSPSEISFSDAEAMADPDQAPYATFSARIKSNLPVKKLSLWVKKNNKWKRVKHIGFDKFSSKELIENGAMNSFNDGIASHWIIWNSADTVADNISSEGYIGSGQHIDITTPGLWGLSMTQDVDLEFAANYIWSFWYKTSGKDPIWAEITNRELGYNESGVELKGTKGKWKHKTIKYSHDYADNDIVRFASTSEHSFSVDQVSLRKVGAYSAIKSMPMNFKIKLDKGKYEWYIEAIDEEGVHRSRIFNVDLNQANTVF